MTSSSHTTTLYSQAYKASGKEGERAWLRDMYFMRGEFRDDELGRCIRQHLVERASTVVA